MRNWSLEHDGSLVMDGQVVGQAPAPDTASKQERLEIAQLIAAAPEMFEALGAIIDFVNDHCYEDIWRNGGHDTQHYCPFCSETSGHGEGCPMPVVLQAIQKAKGKK